MTHQRSREAFGQAMSDGSFIDAPYIGFIKGSRDPDELPKFIDLQRAVNIDPFSELGQRGALRLKGRFVLPNDGDRLKATLYEAAYEHAYNEWTNQQFAIYMTRKGRPRGAGKRRLADQRREAERRLTCAHCEAPLPAGKHSNAVTCSVKCKKARQRLVAKGPPEWTCGRAGRCPAGPSRLCQSHIRK